MRVILNRSDQFGEDGPVEGDIGQAIGIRKIDDDYWVYTIFPEHQGFFLCLIDHLMWPNTTETETFYTTGI